MTRHVRLPTATTRRFDPLSGMLYVDYSYELPIVAPRSPEYDLDTLAERFLAFVKGEATADTPITSAQLRYSSTYALDETVNERIIRQSEHVVLSGALDHIVLDQARDPAERLWQLFCNKLIGNPDNKRFGMPPHLPDVMRQRRHEALPLTFVLLALPFKDQNPFRTPLEPWEIDLGEIVFLGRLAALSLAAWRTHSFGASWIVLSDASLYAPVFDIAPEDADRYVSAVAAAIHRHNLQGMVQVVDLRREAEVHFARAGIDFEDIVSRIRRDLDLLLLNDPGETLRAAFLALTRGQVQGLNLRSLLAEGFDPDDIWHAVYRRGPWWTDPDPHSRNSALEDRIHSWARRVAIHYAATNLALGLTGITDSLVPGAVRATVHAKPNQLAVPRLGRSYPWNGTAALHGDVGAATEAFVVQVQDLSELIDRGYRGVIMPGHDRPWYFTKE